MPSGMDIQRIERDACAIARIPAPNGREAERIEWLRARLAAAAGRRWCDTEGNLVWQLGEPPYELAVLAHVDTVFDVDVEHTVVERDGWLHGPGIGDNSLAVAMTVGVVEQLTERLDRSLVVAFTVGEEGLGGLRGAKHLCAELAPRQVLALEGHGLDAVYADAVGSLRARVTITGPGGHSWWNRERPSATHALAELITAARRECGGVSVNAGVLSGGDAVNAIAAHAEGVLEGRSLAEAALSELADWLANYAVPDGLSIRVDTVDRRPAGRIDRADPLLRAVLRSRKTLDLAAELSDGSTDANAAHALGIPAIALGCARGADMHTPWERIDRSSIEPGALQLDEVLRELLID